MVKASSFTAFLCGAICLLGVVGTAAAQTPAKAPAKDNIKVTHYEDWEVRCIQANNGPKCEMTQLIDNPNSKKPIMRAIVGYPEQSKNAAMIFLTPLGTRLLPGVRVSIDGGKPFRVPFQICSNKGCRAAFPVKPSLLDKFKHGSSAEVAIIGPRGNKISLPLSLSGFTAANAALTQ